MSNVFLFTGQEKYLLNQEIQKRKESFKQKYGQDNIVQIKDSGFDIHQLRNDVFSQGLFSDKKLVIIYGFPKDTLSENKLSKKSRGQIQKYFLEKLDSIPEDIILIFVSYKPDKRRKNYKTIKKKAKVKTFKKLKGKKLESFVSEQLGDKITNTNLKYFLSITGNSTFLIQNEIDKLSLYADYNDCKITKSVIDKIVYSSSDIDAFKLLDNMFSDPQKSLKIIEKIKQTGQNEFQTLGMIYWGLRTIISMIDCYNSGVKDKKKLASKLDLHPFVVSKNYKYITKYKNQTYKLKNLFQNFIELDKNIKTGQLSIDMFWLSVKQIVLQV